MDKKIYEESKTKIPDITRVLSEIDDEYSEYGGLDCYVYLDGRYAPFDHEDFLVEKVDGIRRLVYCPEFTKFRNLADRIKNIVRDSD
jgi:hypothetical protein